MELHQLRYFLRVAHEQHFGRAAESLHVTASPVSRAVKALETELETPLFERGHHTVRLTRAGQKFARGLEPLLEQLDELARSVTATAEHPDTVFALGGTPIAPPHMIDQVVDLIRNATNGGAVQVNVADWEDTLDQIGRNHYDMALYGLPFDDPAVDWRAIAKLEMSVGIRSDDPLAGQDSVTWQDLHQHRLTISPRTQNPSSVNWIRDQSESRGHRLVDELFDQDVTVLATHVRANRGRFLFALPPSAGGPWKILDDPAFTVLPFQRDSPVFELCLVWNRRRHDSDPALAAIVDEVLATWEGSGKSPMRSL